MRKTLLPATVLVAVLAAAFPAWAQEDVPDVLPALEQARGLMDSGRDDEAIALLERVRAAHPDDDRLVPLLAFLLFDRGGELERAFDLIFEYVGRHRTSDPYGPRLLEDISLRALAEGRAVLAREGFRVLKREEPDRKEHFYEWARATYRLGQFRAARVQLNDLIDRFPSYSQPYRLLARIYLEEGSPERAADAYRHLLEQRPADIHARLALASVLLWDLGRHEEAEREYENALEFADEGSDAYLNAEAGLRNARTQRELAKRLRGRMSTLNLWLAGLLLGWGVLFGWLMLRTRPGGERPPRPEDGAAAA
jgi:predicted Zn-dependent protease